MPMAGAEGLRSRPGSGPGGGLFLGIYGSPASGTEIERRDYGV